LNDLGLFLIAGKGIPLGTSDIFLTSLSASLTGLGSPNWSVSGSIGLGFGQQVTLGGKSVWIILAEGSLFLNKDELKLDGNIGLAAYYVSQNSNNNGLGNNDSVSGNSSNNGSASNDDDPDDDDNGSDENGNGEGGNGGGTPSGQFKSLLGTDLSGDVELDWAD